MQATTKPALNEKKNSTWARISHEHTFLIQGESILCFIWKGSLIPFDVPQKLIPAFWTETFASPLFGESLASFPPSLLPGRSEPPSDFPGGGAVQLGCRWAVWDSSHALPWEEKFEKIPRQTMLHSEGRLPCLHKEKQYRKNPILRHYIQSGQNLISPLAGGWPQPLYMALGEENEYSHWFYRTLSLPQLNDFQEFWTVIRKESKACQQLCQISLGGSFILGFQHWII